MSDVPIGAVCYLNPRQNDASLEQFSDRERAILHEINRRVAAADSLASLMDFVFDAVRSLWPTDRIALAYLEDDGHRAVAHHPRANYEPLALRPGYAEDISGSSLERVIQSGRPRVINDLKRYFAEHPQSRSTQLILGEGIRSSLTCPLLIDGRIVGLFFHSSKQPDAYSERHLALNQAIIERLSQAIAKELQIEQLIEANRAYSEMLGFVSHELKQPLATIVMNGRLLLDGYLGPVPERQAEKVQRMIAKSQYLLSLVGEYLDLARIEGGSLQLNPRKKVDMPAETIEPAIEIVEAALEEKQMKLVRDWSDEPLYAQCDPSLVRVVMVNLLSNAVKYGREGGEIRVHAERSPEVFSVNVRNEGPGFAERERPKLFRRFSRLNDAPLSSQGGTGVGLYTCWRIIGLHGGKIRARSEYGKWAEFFFHIPQPLPTEAFEGN